MKQRALFILSVLFASSFGCSRPDPVHEPEGKAWEVSELADPRVKPPEPVSPDASSKERLVFEPGKLSWAKPDHRVVVHLEPEARALMEVPELAPYWELPHFDPEYYATREGGIHHQLRFEYAAYYSAHKRPPGMRTGTTGRGFAEFICLPLRQTRHPRPSTSSR